MRCGVDTGGTFTDVVADDGRIVKVLSTAEEPTRAVREGIGRFGERPTMLAHGTTIATNALLERRGARVALVTTAGFADVIEIARQDRPSLYDLWADRPEPLVPRELRFEVAGRLAADGSELEAVDVGTLPALPPEVESVAVCLLHADLDARHERAVVGALMRRGAAEVSCSSDVSPEFREYERTVTTVVNAYLRPLCRTYLRSLDDLADDVVVMTSAGGVIPAGEAAELPVALLLSGPAGGVNAAAAAARSAGFGDAVTFDMGGTSTDVCLVRGGLPEPAAGRVAAGFPIRLPALDVHTIGAGGGSIARIDAGGALVVGPRSAGADPGPACYGRGGSSPTVTDADLVLGRILDDAVFPGLGRLDRAAAEQALDAAGVTADGVVAVVDAHMQLAVRAVSVERGVDPAGLALVAFGGAGPLHACAIAEAVGMAAVIVPPRAGVLSAVGLLCSPRQRDLVRSWPSPADLRGVGAALADLAVEARSAVGTEDDQDGAVEVTTSVDCRYAGQSFELTVPFLASEPGRAQLWRFRRDFRDARATVQEGASLSEFHEEHRRRNGYARPGAPVEVIALRARARVPSGITLAALGPTPSRSPATGPSVLAEPDCTVWVPDGWAADVAPDGSWLLTR